MSDSNDLTPSQEPAVQPERRKRKILEQFYGTNTSSDKKSKENEFNLNSGSFNPEKYVKKLLKEQTLNGLMKKDIDLANQIKSLDTDLQMMVYENYNKFITATDTIKKMKNHVMSMEDEMKNLSKTMEDITACSNLINKNLGEKREKIDKLSSVNRMLKKMQFLLELPARLNQCLDMKTYAVAVKYYNIASKILAQYSHLPSFRTIQQESVDVMNKLKNTLKGIVFKPTASAREIEEYLKLLLELKEPVEGLRKEFLSNKKDKLKNLVQGYKIDPALGIRTVRFART
jgi:hypothetical protein